MAQLTKDQAVLRAIWGKAVKEGGLDLPWMGEKAATRMRFMLFREAKQMRAEGVHGLIDPMLLESMEQYTVRVEEGEEGEWRAVIAEKGTPALAELADVLGIEVSPAEGQQNLVEESLRRLKSITDGTDFAPPAHRFSAPMPVEPATHAALEPAKHNPFYSREG